MTTLRPADEAELSALLEDRRTPLRITGGGTRLAWPDGPAETLETTALSGITLYEPGALTLVARAGTPLDEVEQTLAAQGQRLPFEVPDLRGLLGTRGRSTLGGVVAANASGPRRLQAGACRDSLIGLRFVDGAGTVIKNGGRVMKNVTGYDLVKLLAGSHGTLGVLTEVSFKLLPVPAASATLALRGLDLARAVAAMSAAMSSPFEVTGAAHWPGEGTYLRIEGFADSVAYRSGRLAALLAPFAPAEALDAAETARLWAAIRDAAPFHGQPGDVWKLSVKPSDAPALAARLGAEQILLDWAGGLVWARLAPGTDLRARLGAFQGHATRLRGEGGGAPAFHPQPAPLATIAAGLRARFDPRGILNPGLMG